MRINDTFWFKTGIEYFNNFQHMSTVVTRGETEYSDWSVTLLNDITANRGKAKERGADSDEKQDGNLQLVTKYNPETLYLRVTRLMIHDTSKIMIEFSYDNKQWHFFRKFYFAPKTNKVQFGLMACSPKRTEAGFNAKFDGFELRRLSKEEVQKYDDPVPDPKDESDVKTGKS